MHTRTHARNTKEVSSSSCSRGRAKYDRDNITLCTVKGVAGVRCWLDLLRPMSELTIATAFSAHSAFLQKTNRAWGIEGMDDPTRGVLDVFVVPWPCREV